MTRTPPQIQVDRELADAVSSGDRAAFDRFFREYFPRLYRFALTRVNNDPTVAEEVVQRTMCIVVRKMRSYRGEALLFTWLCQICRNEMHAYFRQAGVDRQVDVPIEDHPAVQAALESLSADDFRPDSAQQRSEIAGFVRAALDHLPERYALALEMKYINGHSVAEIAEALGVGEKAAESVLTRARTAFKDGLRSLWDVDSELATDT